MTREELEDELEAALSFCSEDVGEQAKAALSVFEKYVCTDAGEPEVGDEVSKYNETTAILEGKPHERDWVIKQTIKKADGRPVLQLDKETST